MTQHARVYLMNTDSLCGVHLNSFLYAGEQSSHDKKDLVCKVRS